MNQDIHSHLEKLKVELNKLEPAVKHLQEADKNTAALISNADNLFIVANSVLEIHEKLIKSNEKLIVQIDKVNFPTRLDKIEATVSSINVSLQKTQKCLGDIERNIKDDLQQNTKIISKVDSIESSLKYSIENFQKLTTSQFEKQSKENKLLKILLFVSIGLIVGLIVFSVISGK